MRVCVSLCERIVAIVGHAHTKITQKKKMPSKFQTKVKRASFSGVCGCHLFSVCACLCVCAISLIVSYHTLRGRVFLVVAGKKCNNLGAFLRGVGDCAISRNNFGFFRFFTGERVTDKGAR